MRSRTLRSAADLVGHGLIADDAVPEIDAVARRYAVAVTPYVASLIDAADPNDPIARQYVPSSDELASFPTERSDPIGDEAHSPITGLVHRYPDRVLLKVLQVCAVYCRFCFRREHVGPGQGALTGAQIADALRYIQRDPNIWEVILTGGDPLMLSAKRLRHIIGALADIDHVKIVRIHTRVPVVDPDRVTSDMVDALRCDGVTTWVAIHANHPREFNAPSQQACARIADAGIPLVSQSVLLKGINDDAETLVSLMRCFVEHRIKPYYLHHGDLAPGTAHLRTTLAQGRRLIQDMRGRVSGLCQPHYVLDIPGGFGKANVAASDLDSGTMRVRDYCGDVHAYPPDFA